MPDDKRETKWEQAAQLIAKGELGVGAIAARLGIAELTLYRWRKDPEFAARVDVAIEEQKAAIRRRAIGWVERRVDRLNTTWLGMQQVIKERALDPSMEAVPGGQTGLLSRDVKAVGAEVREVYKVDVGLIKELREHEKQAAIELGQWEQKKEAAGFDDVDDLVDAYLDGDDQQRKTGPDDRVLPPAVEPDQRGERDNPPVG